MGMAMLILLDRGAHLYPAGMKPAAVMWYLAGPGVGE